MAIGTPFAKSPIYNRDGYLRFTDNRLRGFQAGISGSPLQTSYRLLTAYRCSHVTRRCSPLRKKRHSTSVTPKDATSSLK